MVTVDRVGTVWVAAGTPCDIWTLQPSGTVWTRSPVAGCPLGRGGVAASMTVDGSGVLWVGAEGYAVNGLAAHAAGRWQTYEDFIGLPGTRWVRVLGTAPTGEPWIWSNWLGAREAPWVARLDGAAWTVTPIPDGEGWPAAVAPDGALWTSGLARYDGQAWTHPYRDLPMKPSLAAIATDGTVFAVGVDGTTLVRLPAPPTQPPD